MSVTRRHFLKTIAGGTTALLASCTASPSSWLPNAAPAVLGARELVVWTTSYGIDAALARWRGAHPRQPVTRRILSPTELSRWLTEVQNDQRACPDAVVSDASTITEWYLSGLWRQLDASPAGEGLHVGIGRIHTTSKSGARYAIPLAVNPIGAWYSQAIMATILPDSDPTQVAIALGKDSQAFQAFLNRASTALSDGPLLSSTLDDFLIPNLEHAVMQNTDLSQQWQTLLEQSAHTLQKAQLSAGERHFSGNWYKSITHEHTGLIIAGRWMKTALMRAVGESTSTWRVSEPAGGFIAGPSLVCAIPDRSNQPEPAIAFATDLASDLDLQLLLCEGTGTVPTLLAAHQYAPFVGPDRFCGGQSVGELWCTAATNLNAVPLTPERIEQRRRIRTAFIAAVRP